MKTSSRNGRRPPGSMVHFDPLLEQIHHLRRQKRLVDKAIAALTELSSVRRAREQDDGGPNVSRCA